MRKIKSLIAATWLAAGAMAGAQAAPIVVGQVGPMSGLDAAQGRAYAVGMQLVFDRANKAGGVNGHTFSLVRKDDGGRPEDTVSATRQMLAQDKPLVLAGYFGSRNVADLVKSGLLEKDRIALVGYRTAEIRPETPLLYSVRASLRDEINKLTEHLATIGITRLGLLYEEGPGAAALLAASDEAVRRAKATLLAKAAYPAGTANTAAAVQTFLKTPPQAILMVASGAAAAAFIEDYRASGGAAQLFAHSGADIEQMSKRLAEEQMQGVAIAQVTPSPYKISSRLAKEFSDTAAAQKLEVPVSYAMMEGFIAGKVIVEAVRRQGARPTREGVVATLDAMETYDLGGYVVGFRPGMRSGSRFVELSIISGSGKIRQ
ncbi:ABC transporter substrate-binding protein [Ramlibacter tataouinensis]|uniref:Candidate ABC type branched chain amino acid transport systems, periplasmic component n=1 Tax=Ramlibacter tataouinensis (strain ATCC BAA-407 / DSM 14655 / LMG 21543 / TTB310) TaxID=365046 RepID=F5XVP6_RAMTT|nr:ABC transporter substrate-binding protein [Ramlibacter tataouinensis]AEG92809.1 candidate ABC type branched chain amino acid transport systems, periplasmic component [Ramlibacter tataouinensis TTB310]